MPTRRAFACDAKDYPRQREHRGLDLVRHVSMLARGLVLGFIVGAVTKISTITAARHFLPIYNSCKRSLFVPLIAKGATGVVNASI